MCIQPLHLAALLYMYCACCLQCIKSFVLSTHATLITQTIN